MLELIAFITVASLLLGLITWQVNAFVSDSAYLEGWRSRLWGRYGGEDVSPTFKYLYTVLACPQSFSTTVAVAVTWGTIAAAIFARPDTPVYMWAVALVLGPALTSAWTKVLRTAMPE